MSTFSHPRITRGINACQHADRQNRPRFLLERTSETVTRSCAEGADRDTEDCPSVKCSVLIIPRQLRLCRVWLSAHVFESLCLASAVRSDEQRRADVRRYRENVEGDDDTFRSRQRRPTLSWRRRCTKRKVQNLRTRERSQRTRDIPSKPLSCFCCHLPAPSASGCPMAKRCWFILRPRSIEATKLHRGITANRRLSVFHMHLSRPLMPVLQRLLSMTSQDFSEVEDFDFFETDHGEGKRLYVAEVSSIVAFRRSSLP